MAIKISDKVIYETTDYDMFEKLLGNRDPKHEKAIIDSINKVGYIFDPITVNEKYQIIDGQNRLEALRKLGLPVHFSIEKGIGIDECRQMNIGRSNWSTEDYIYSYAEIGSQDYRRLASLLMEFKKRFMAEGVYAFAKPESLTESGGWTVRDRKHIKEGTFTMTQEEYELARTRLKNADEIGYTDLYKMRKFRARAYWGAVAYVYLHRQAEARKVIAKLREATFDIPTCQTVTEQLRYFDEANNKGVRGEHRIFMSADFQNRKYMEKGR